MNRVKENLYFITTLLNSTSPKQRKNLLKYASKDQILALSEIVINFLNGNVTVANDSNFTRFQKYKKLFRIIGSEKKISWHKRQQALIKLGKILVIFLKDVRNLWE